MVDRPLVSVVTPTWGRDDYLGRTIQCVMNQTYRPIQHVLVADGPNQSLKDSLRQLTGKHLDGYELVVADLPEHEGTLRWGHFARLRGIELAAGEYIAYLDDDDEYCPDHIEKLAALLSDPEIGFAYSRIMIHEPTGDVNSGQAPPCYAGVSTSALMNKKEILNLATWVEDGNYYDTIDWNIVARWLDRGVRWAFNDAVTVQAHRDAPNLNSDRARNVNLQVTCNLATWASQVKLPTKNVADMQRLQEGI